MSSAHSALTTETSAEPSISEHPDDRPYLEVISAFQETTQYPVKPGTTLALKPGKGLPGLPNHYNFFFAYPDLSSHDDSALRDPYASSTDPHRNDSEVFWHPMGRRGQGNRSHNCHFPSPPICSGRPRFMTNNILFRYRQQRVSVTHGGLRTANVSKRIIPH
jgi:hypothetical protein